DSGVSAWRVSDSLRSSFRYVASIRIGRMEGARVATGCGGLRMRGYEGRLLSRQLRSGLERVEHRLRVKRKRGRSGHPHHRRRYVGRQNRDGEVGREARGTAARFPLLAWNRNRPQRQVVWRERDL